MTSCNLVALKVKIDGEMVAAEGVVALGFVIGLRQLPVVSRRLAVLQDDVLIELAQIGHQAKTSFTFWMPSTSAIDFGAGVVQRERSARGGWNAEELHHRLRAVMSGADRDAFAIEDRADVVRDECLR